MEVTDKTKARDTIVTMPENGTDTVPSHAWTNRQPNETNHQRKGI